MVNSINPLTVYKASAGSGKTFTLTVEYIKLLIQDPSSFHNILAVTFTNKATEEMKMRILSMLYGLSRQLPEAQSYMDNIVQSTGFAPVMVATQAGEALRLLLHNYNYFRVETIDKFFQSVLRNMASELDLTANLHIGLNDVQVEEQAVDELIDGLNVHDKVFGWIMQYVKENISEDKGWNVINLIKRFGRNIFRDIYRDNSKKLNEALATDNFFDDYTRILKEMRDHAEDHFKHYAATFMDMLEENGLQTTDFSNGNKGVCSYFIKMGNGKYGDADVLTNTVKAAMEDADKWVKKAELTPDNPKYKLVCETLLPYLQETERMRQVQSCLYVSANLTLRHLNQLRLLENIEKTIREMNSDANRFLLSDTQHLLNGMIQDSDSPFIFEKIGTRLKHIMIDEFQDTSTIQWKNFKILLMDCMSNEDTQNLIVGDVKQSIYRWRSGDWKLLNNIESEFPDQSQSVTVKSLVTNYRSDYNIITFNNVFFSLATQYEARSLDGSNEVDQLIQAYADVEQKPHNTLKRGRVEMTLIPSTEYGEQIMEKIHSMITTILEQGHAPSSIAILCRSKSTIQEIARFFGENYPSVPLISDEAFRLDASVAVNTLISALRYVSNPESSIDRAYLKQVGILAPVERTRDQLLTMPLYDMVQTIYAMLDEDICCNQSAYIFAFFDQLAKYLKDNMSDIDDFLNEWDNTLHEKAIQSSMDNGIRLLTIHKSKGLEYDHIIIPACDWKLEQSNSTLWCTPKVDPFSRMPLVPIDFSKKGMVNSIYEDDYYYEHLQNVVDNLNLLYVAFTRAKSSLYILGKRGTQAMRSGLLEGIWDDLAQALNTTYTGNLDDKTDTLHLEFGTFPAAQSKPTRTQQPTEERNVFRKTSAPMNMPVIKAYKSVATFRQSNQSIEFTHDNEGDNHNQYIKLGNVLHKVFSTIRTSADIDKALQQLENDGILYDNEVKREQLVGMLRKRLDDDRVSEWFSPRWTVLNECSLLFYDRELQKSRLLRPDRVITDGEEYIVIDFKFGTPKEEYHTQVREYMHLLSEMGHSRVKGYLWFVYSNKIEEVK